MTFGEAVRDRWEQIRAGGSPDQEDGLSRSMPRMGPVQTQTWDTYEKLESKSIWDRIALVERERWEDADLTA